MEPIKGLLFEMSAEELVKHFTLKAEFYTKKKDKCKDILERAKAIKTIRDIDEDMVAGVQLHFQQQNNAYYSNTIAYNSSMTVPASDFQANFEAQKAQIVKYWEGQLDNFRTKVKLFQFYSTHVVPHARYHFTLSQLAEVEL